MDWEIVFVIGLLIAAFVSFVWEKIPTDLTSFTVFASLLAASAISRDSSLPSPEQLMQVFASPAPITIAAMFVISVVLERCGAIDNLSNLLGKFTFLGYHFFLLLMMTVVAMTSAFVNNTPVVIVLLPAVMTLANKMQVPASKMLIPLSFASILGGMTTAIGTSTNLLVNGILLEHNQPPLRMFELSSIGIPLFIAASLYLMLFGKKLLPLRETLTSMLSEEERKEYITEAFVRESSELAGKKVNETNLTGKSGMRLIEVVRNAVAVKGNLKEIVLKPGDRLVLACRPSSIMEAREIEGIDFVSDKGLDLEQISAHEGSIVEGVIGPLSSIAGKTIDEINFRQRFRMVILAIHRHGRNVREKIQTLNLQFGDTLLMMGTDRAIENLRRSDDIILLDRPPLPAQNLKQKKPFIIVVLICVIVAASSGIAFHVASLTGVAILLVTGCLKPKEAYESIEWSILILIFGMLSLGMAMQTTGITAHITEALTEIAVRLHPDYRAYVMLALIYIVTNITTEMLTNNAVAILMAPLGIALAVTMGLDPRPFVIAICVAASASFSTPIGYQTNTYVYGVGGYKFRDFPKIGIPLNIMVAIIAIYLIPKIWPFQAALP